MRTVKDPSASFLSLLGQFPASESGQQADVYLAQHNLILRQQLPMGVINILAASMIVFSIQNAIGLRLSLGWASPIILMGLLQVTTWYRFRNKPEPTKVSGSFLRKGEVMALLAGLCWGSCSLLIVSANDPSLALFVYVMQTGMSAGVASLITPLPRHTARFALPCLLPAAFSPFYGGTGDYTITVSVLVIAFMIVLINSSLQSYKQLSVTIGKSWEALSARNHLIDAIESTNDAFAFFDENGKLALGNAQFKFWFEGLDTLNLDAVALDGTETVRQNGRWMHRSVRKTAQGGYVVVANDITALKARERELVDARREAVEADEAKGRFLSTMSHELRTPLNIILGFSRLMSTDSQVHLSDAEVAEYSDSINESGTHLLRLIDDIIDYSKVGLDRFMLETQSVDVRAMIKKAVTLAASFENVEDLTKIDISISPKLGNLRIDERVCRRIVMNLLTNAMRYRGGDGRVVVRAGLDADERPFIAVRDFGKGIPEDKVERVFEAFYQVSEGLDRGAGGTGLGLTLCRHLSRLHGGDIVLKSRLGIGTTATFVLPKTTYIPKGQAPVEAADFETRVA